jgi:hypothetical protein
MEFGSPKAAGKSLHGQPVRILKRITSIKFSRFFYS